MTLIRINDAYSGVANNDRAPTGVTWSNTGALTLDDAAATPTYTVDRNIVGPADYLWFLIKVKVHTFDDADQGLIYVRNVVAGQTLNHLLHCEVNPHAGGAIQHRRLSYVSVCCDIDGDEEVKFQLGAQATGAGTLLEFRAYLERAGIYIHHGG